jgi:hypothetical protein
VGVFDTAKFDAGAQFSGEEASGVFDSTTFK